MDLNRTPAAIANAAAEEIRALNHRTLDTKSFDNPAAVSDTANAMAALLERLPQTLQQIESGLVQLELNNRIRLAEKPLAATTGQDIRNEVHTVASALTDARNLIRQARTVLAEATGPLSNMGSPWDDDEDGAE